MQEQKLCNTGTKGRHYDNQVNPQLRLSNQGSLNMRCSRHIPSNRHAVVRIVAIPCSPHCVAPSAPTLAASLTAPETDKTVHVERALARLLQHGHVTPASVPALLGALKTAQQYKDKGLVRLVYFLVQLALGDGSAGAPLPMPFSKGGYKLCSGHLAYAVSC